MPDTSKELERLNEKRIDDFARGLESVSFDDVERTDHETTEAEYRADATRSLKALLADAAKAEAASKAQNR